MGCRFIFFPFFVLLRTIYVSRIQCKSTFCRHFSKLSYCYRQRKMTGSTVIITMLLFLTMQITVGQPPENCVCHFARGVTLSCATRGCSKGSNRFCKDGGFDTLTADVLSVVLYGNGVNRRDGCTCPAGRSTTHNRGHGHRNSRSHNRGHSHGHHTPSNHHATHNGYMGGSGYHYDTCTAYGGNARDRSGNVLSDANYATDCCNYCCGRNDPHPIPPATNPILTNNGHKIGVSKPLYWSSLIMLPLVALYMI